MCDGPGNESCSIVYQVKGYTFDAHGRLGKVAAWQDLTKKSEAEASNFLNLMFISKGDDVFSTSFPLTLSFHA